MQLIFVIYQCVWVWMIEKRKSNVIYDFFLKIKHLLSNKLD